MTVVCYHTLHSFTFPVAATFPLIDTKPAGRERFGMSIHYGWLCRMHKGMHILNVSLLCRTCFLPPTLPSTIPLLPYFLGYIITTRQYMFVTNGNAKTASSRVAALKGILR